MNSRGACLTCGRVMYVRHDGTLIYHRDTEGAPCDGSRTAPAPAPTPAPIATPIRPDLPPDPDAFTESFALWLRANRWFAGISRAELAERTGVTVSTVCRWEGGKHVPSIYFAARACNALGVTLPPFATGEAPMPRAADVVEEDAA